MGYKILTCISDIHIGNKNISANDYKKMLENNYFKPMEQMFRLDAIIVAGDVSDTVISLNSDYGELYLWFFNRLYKVAKKRKEDVKIIVVKGTKSHDLDHLSTVKHLEKNDDGIDFRIYENFQIDYLFEDYKMLILPDIKINKKMKQHVEELLEGQYDIVIGHGFTDKINFGSQESENLNTEAYHFSLRKLMGNCKGPILFGHYHVHTNVQNKFYYCGSFTKLERGEGTHGFLVIGINDEDHSQFVVEQYLNKDSIDYHRIKITEKDLSEYDAHDMIDAIKSFILSCGKNDLFTINIKIENNTYVTDKVYMIDDAFRGNKYVSIVKKVYDKKEEENHVSISNKKERLRYIFDQGLSVQEVFTRYYNEEIRPNNPKYKDFELDPVIVSEILTSY